MSQRGLGLRLGLGLGLELGPGLGLAPTPTTVLRGLSPWSIPRRIDSSPFVLHKAQQFRGYFNSLRRV